jgi:hypothetical protein
MITMLQQHGFWALYGCSKKSICGMCWAWGQPTSSRHHAGFPCDVLLCSTNKFK